MGSWKITCVTKDDPNSIVICRDYSGADVRTSPFLLSVGERSQSCELLEAPRVGGEQGPLEFQVTTGSGRTAVFFVHRNRFEDHLIVKGHVDGGRHEYGWRETKKARKFHMQSSARAMTVHVGADGILRLAAVGEWAFLLEWEGQDMEFKEVELGIPMLIKR